MENAFKEMPYLEKRDLAMFDWYRDMYNQSTRNEKMISSEALLSQFWQPAKGEYLYKMLGNQLILTKPVTFNRPRRDIENEACTIIRENQNFISTYNDVIYYLATTKMIDDNTYVAMNVMTNYNNLTDNRVSVAFELNLPEMSKALKITSGMKIMKALGKVVEAVKDYVKFCRHEYLRDTDLVAAFEQFRLAHSLILNQKTLKGTLCLSIHPLDFATASDNECGWSSCMSWVEEGCYRLGTVEMMNSPMVVSVYLASDKSHMDIGGEQWNSKKWRAWAIVTKDIILMNRNFPYENAELNHIALRWIKELAETNLGWKYTYSPKTFDELNIHFETNYMYNDVAYDMPYVIRPDYDSHVDNYINFSGAAQCMCCGEQIDYDEDNRDNQADDLCCSKCSSKDYYYCCDCGCAINSEDDVYYDDDGNIFCCDCYNDRYVNCWECDCDVNREDAYTICIETKSDFRNELGDVIKRRIQRDWCSLNIWTRERQTCENCLIDDIHKLEDETELDFEWSDVFLRRTDFDDHYLFMNPAAWTEKTACDFMLDNYVPYWGSSDRNNAEKSFREDFHKLWAEWVDYLIENKDKFVEA